MIYVRTISIYRPTPASNGSALQIGLVGYQGLAPSNETPIFSDIPASIQAEALGNARNTNVPADAPGPTKWTIYIPKTALPLGAVKDRDIVVDDLGDRYQVSASYWNLLGYKLMSVRTEA